MLNKINTSLKCFNQHISQDIFRYLLWTLLVVVAVACAQDTNTAVDQNNVKPLNPNGDSELALLMRVMHEEGMKIKAQVENGELPKINQDFEKILTAVPTESGKTESAIYQSFANAYIASIKALMQSNPAEVQNRYVEVVNTCMNCHEQVCPGPMMVINKLYPKEGVLRYE